MSEFYEISFIWFWDLGESVARWRSAPMRRFIIISWLTGDQLR